MVHFNQISIPVGASNAATHVLTTAGQPELQLLDWFKTTFIC
jgi:hypothetical protein